MVGRAYNGRVAKGKGSDRSGTNSSRKDTTESKKQTMEFTPHTAGKHQSVTYDTVVEHILQDIQKDLKNRSDMAVNLRNGVDTGVPIFKPRRQIARRIKTVFKNEEQGEGESSEAFDDPKEELRMKQEGYDMEYTLDLKEWKVRQNTYEENKFKAYTIVFGYCNRTMQNRIKESTNFESDIQNNPFLILETIKLKMYGQVRAKYEYVQPTDTILQFLSLKQDHGESLIDYGKRFKQSVDNLKAIFGKGFLNEYIEKTDAYKKAKPNEGQKLKKEAFSSWTSYVYLKNSDGNKYGLLKKNLQAQYALQNNQYPKTISTMTDVLTNHQWDDKYKAEIKQKKDSSSSHSGGGGQ